ncbi:hypothetical protein VPNG_01898 [Cytospora leucostoma]|uniref:Elongin-A n=1 Tax=Cytospora leucostoma TaxID=1230097 RepID=A0A423XJ47_9PEZI|nr:hypothetical protein VPNG_01898 [Cytospora leucostoma]
MSVPSLAGLCRKTIFANIDELSYVSTLPYEKCREILQHVKTPQQLAVIEEYSPQIVGEDSELWEAFIKKHFRVPMKRKNYEPENPRSWRKVYERYAKEEAEEEAAALAQLGATFAGLNKAKQENKTGIADPRLLPSAGRTGGIARSRNRGFGTGTANLTFGGGARTSNVVKKAKKEAMEVAARKKLSTPALKPRANLVKVQQAPESMRNEYRIKRQPAFLPPTAKTATKRPREDDDRAQREARLLAAKKPKVLRDDELENTTHNAPEPSKPLATASTRSGASSNSKKPPAGIFSHAHNPSRQQNNKVIVKTGGSQPVSRASPEKASGALRARPDGHSSPAKTHLTSSRPTAVSRTTKAFDSPPISRVSSPGLEDFKPRKNKPRRSSRSSSVASSLFGSPEPGSPASDRGRRSSFHSDDGHAPSTSPPPATTKRPGTSEAARAGSPPQRHMEDLDAAGTSSAAATSAAGGGGGASAQPPRKKKRVDIFMRPKKIGR